MAENSLLNELTQPGGMNTLESLIAAYLAGQQPQETGPKFITAGNRVMGMDNSKDTTLDRMGGALNNLAANYLMAQQIKKRNDFFKSVNTIMGSNDGGDQEVKRDALRRLIMAHGGEDYGLGIKDVLWADMVKPKGLVVNNTGGIPEDMEVVGYDQKGQPMIRKRQPTIIEKEKAKADAKEAAKIQESKRKAQEDFLTAKNKLSTTWAAFQAMEKAGGGGGTGPGTKLKAVLGRELAGKAGINPYTEAYKGQLNEAAAALAKLASPSARVGQEIIEMFRQTLPSTISTTPEAMNQIRFSLHNAFATVLSKNGEEYTPELRDKVDEMFADVMSEPALNLTDKMNNQIPKVGGIFNGKKIRNVRRVK